MPNKFLSSVKTAAVRLGALRGNGAALVVAGLLVSHSVLRIWGAPSGTALPVIDEKWRHFASPHFELYSRNADAPSRELLHNLELLRAVFLDRMKLEERLHVPVTVFYFHSKSEFQAYAPEALRANFGLAGFHLFRPDRAVISMAPAEDSEMAQQTIFHEYVHHLFQIAESRPPLWFNEGMAEVLAGIRVDGKRVRIGTPVENRALYLREESLLPLDQLFAADQSARIYADEKHTGVFYAQSWALLHFWYFGDSGFSKEGISRFLAVAGDRDVAGRTDLRKLFQACFGCDYPEMLHRLKKYIRTGSYRSGSHPTPDLEAAASYAVRPVAVDEITLRLAELAVRVEHSAAGKLILMNATSRWPNDPRPFETLGTEAYFEHDERTAAERWEQALAAGSKNPAVVRELALMEGHQWFRQFEESLRLPPEAVARMRSRLLRSIEIEPAQGAAYEMLSWVEAFAETPAAKNVNLVIGHLSAMPDKRRTLIGLSMLMLRVGKPRDAAMMLDHLDSLSLDPLDARAATVLRARLDADYPDVATARIEGAQTVAPPSASPGLKTPSVSLPDDL